MNWLSIGLALLFIAFEATPSSKPGKPQANEGKACGFWHAIGLINNFPNLAEGNELGGWGGMRVSGILCKRGLG